MPKKATLENRISTRVKRSKSSAFVRKDFADIGGYDQVGRALRQLVENGALIKLGYGVYARTKESRVTGNVILDKSLGDLGKEAMWKIGVKTAPTTAEAWYCQGISNQVPTGRVVGVKSRVSRKLSYNGKSISFEKVAARA